MAELELLNSTGNSRVDAIIRGLIEICELVFPGRIKSYYLSGSYSDGTGKDLGNTIHSSDIDMFAVFSGRLEEDENDKFHRLVRAGNGLSGTQLDLHPASEEDLCRNQDNLSILNVILKVAGLPLYGEDIRPKILELPPQRYLIHVINHGFYNIGLPRQQAGPLSYPLAIPFRYPLSYLDPEGEFFGYDYRHKRKNGEIDRPGTRILVSIVVWIATFIMARKSGRYAGTKAQAIQLYRELVNDEWSGLIEAVFNKGKLEWGYAIPEKPEERQQLRELCRQALALENYFLDQSRAYLLAQLESPDQAAKKEALSALQNVIYPGPETVNALEKLLESADEELRPEVEKTLAVARQNL